MAKFSEKFFCPAPWTMMYYHLNSPSPCHMIRNHQLNMTPEEYLNSDWLKNIKKTMVSGGVPVPCSGCKIKEDLGLKSTRGATWGYYNVGPEPEYEDMWFANKFTGDSKTVPYRVELRFSNLCNMKCRPCDETSSSEWAKEKIENDIPFLPVNKSMDRTESVIYTKPESVNGLKQLLLDSPIFRKLCFTGGEPFVIKEYYDYLDFMIENKMNDRVKIELYTNCSVYNPLFIDRLHKFEEVEFVMSIDGVGKTAEYIRSGTDWARVEKNIRLFNLLPHPFKQEFNTAISSYTLLDMSSLASFLMSLYEENKTIQTKCYHVGHPPELHFSRMDNALKERALSEIDKAVEILTAPNFLILSTELQNIKKKLLATTPVNPESFYEFTNKFDLIRNEKFEDVYGIKLGNV